MCKTSCIIIIKCPNIIVKHSNNWYYLPSIHIPLQNMTEIYFFVVSRFSEATWVHQSIELKAEQWSVTCKMGFCWPSWAGDSGVKSLGQKLSFKIGVI